MARPIKKGLDYFPLDVVLEDDVELFEAECGLEGFAILIKLYQKIYQSSYYIKWGEDNSMLFARKINTSIDKIKNVIKIAFKRNLLNENLYDKYKILTSKGIQSRFFKIYNDCRRKGLKVNTDFVLVNDESIGVNVELTKVNSESSTQSKQENKKEEDIKKNKKVKTKKFNPHKDSYTDEYEKVYSIYPSNSGKRQGMVNFYKCLNDYSYEELIRTIERYKISIKKEKISNDYIYKITNFFGLKSYYEDFLDENYKEIEEKKDEKLVLNKNLPDDYLKKAYAIEYGKEDDEYGN